MKILALSAAAFLLASGARAEMDEHAAKAVEHLKAAQAELKQSPAMGHAHGDFKKADVQINAAVKNVQNGDKLFQRDQSKKAGKKGHAATGTTTTSGAAAAGSGSAVSPEAGSGTNPPPAQPAATPVAPASPGSGSGSGS